MKRAAQSLLVVLVGLALLRAPEEQAAVGPKIVVHLQDDFKVAILPVGDDDAAVPGLVLAPDDRPILDDPAAARAVPCFAADVPAAQGLPVEDRDEPVVGGRLPTDRRRLRFGGPG